MKIYWIDIGTTFEVFPNQEQARKAAGALLYDYQSLEQVEIWECRIDWPIMKRSFVDMFNKGLMHLPHHVVHIVRRKPHG